MKLPASQALYQYWDSVRGARCAPERHDLDPAGMRGVLAYTFMLEVDAGDADARHYPILVSGTRLDALFGRTLNGVGFFADLWSPADRAGLLDLVDGVLATTQPAVVGVTGAPDGYADCAFELLILPLRHNGRTHARLLCSLVPVATPSWIGLRSLKTLSLRTWRSIAPDGTRFAEGARFSIRRAVTPRREHLLVHDGGRAAAPVGVRSVQVHVNRSVRPSGLTLLSTAFHDSAAQARPQT